ncbi:hypothetical protein IF188_19210 [Microbacterium sp. NEAU-LLC]|uniref:DUF2746 domain-containing protein n=2 Tax=Microbacterium helvum TaxID=2773713 RepID=A0ABR8NT70_9MICO|nr:hypothetical protein [Microbacterium helvum]
MNADNWLYIAALTTVMLGGTTIIVTLTNRSTTSAIHGLRGEVGGQIDSLRGDLGGKIDKLQGEVNGLRGEMSARFEAVDARFEAVNTRIDNLDRDVQALVKHTFGIDRG